MSNWALWLCVLVPIPIFWLCGRGKGISAGADWFRSSSSNWIKTYDLIKVHIHGASVGMPWDLELADSEGRMVYTALRKIQRNRRLWDLVYNGILHSVPGRRDATNKRAVEILKLAGFPEGLLDRIDNSQWNGSTVIEPPRMASVSRT